MSLFFVNSQQDNDLDGEGASGSASAAVVPQNVSEAHTALLAFWPKMTEEIKKISQVRLDVKTQALPLARIKKIMKLDEDVKMISAEAPMLFSKAAELFIHELTLRAWIHTEDNKRRTLQRNDIAMAITKYDQFDFLIDIVPRDEIKTTSSRSTNEARTPINPDQVHYYFHLAQQHQAALQQASAAPASSAPAPAPTIQQNGGNTNNSASQPHMVQLQTNQGQTGIQLVQQVVTANGEIQNVPIQLSPSQLQMIRMQLNGGTSSPIIVQAHPQIIQVNQQNSGSTPVYLSQATSNNNPSEAE
ncbi:nuclear transcription factor Y subunit gamma-like isoform X2 [Macrosteles quadrilineatus]|uniref:nuclear transcription factor Y subunit gamma-like isoform X2 n=1 Tax=Macrosteles quadrilineatus TaxID=74068 RepID=UPI0023E0CD24|nr:nuclear transcription factor Y subunit gamma-like isoform X2 [Macrosteles quadrilineatus]XP_054275747.1 nuclear transcription factor Y subunit gamma-like isoform X2 [Macrosteles quadrilineatus]